MKASELMVGDLIYEGGYIQHKVECLCPEEIDGMMEECYSPIPLTPEILEENGFEYSSKESNSLSRSFIYAETHNHIWVEVSLYTLPINGCNCLVRIETDSQTCGGINKVHNCDIQSVHQLQHALRLCGIEKEITV